MPTPPGQRSSDQLLAVVRRVLAVILVAAMVGLFGELLLVEHFDDVWQLIPLGLLALGLVSVAWHALAPSLTSGRVLRIVMAAFVLAGFVGFYLHYAGNVEFELEQNPNATRWTLFREAMMGATPALAPGVMIQIGLLGLLYAFVAKGTAKMRESRIQNSEFK